MALGRQKSGYPLTAAGALAGPSKAPVAKEQAVGRAYRLGRERPVHVVVLQCINSVDEHIRDVLGQKEKVVARVMVSRLREEAACPE